VVVAGKLNIRRKPTVGPKQVRVPLKKGTLVKVLDEQNGWYKVKVETEGWVSAKWIDMI
jgi:N-acetylmuramoyl-L-alanine amidase